MNAFGWSGRSGARRWLGMCIGLLLACWMLAAQALPIAPALTITPATLPNGTQGTAYSQTLTATGGSAPYTFSMSGFGQPPGLTLFSNGTFSGTPTTPGTYTFTVSVTDTNNALGTQTYTITIAATSGPTITITPASLPAGSYNVAYSQTLSASGGSAPYTFAVTQGFLPSGFTLSSAGVLSGTPTSTGTSSFVVTATDSLSGQGSISYQLVVTAPTITFTPSTLPNGTVGTTYNQSIVAGGGASPYTYQLYSGGTGLPPGLSFSSGGVLSGTPTAPGTYNFFLGATDANSVTNSQEYFLTIDAAVGMTIAPSTLPNGAEGASYAPQTLTTTGGTGPYSYAVIAGALPPGLSLDAATGVISGTAGADGTYNFTIRSTGASPATAQQNYTIVIAPATMTPTNLPNGVQGTAYPAQTFVASGTTAWTYALVAGGLPQGLTLSSGGALTGTPGVTGSYNFTVQATGANGAQVQQNYTLVVAVPTTTIVLAPNNLPNGNVGAAYNQTITASGGTAPYAFAVSAGSLPAGLTLASNGALTGTPTTAGTSNFTVTATDANGATGARNYLITANPPVIGNIVITPPTLPNGEGGAGYRQTLTASGGVAPYRFAVTAGSLPSGIALSSAGVLSGVLPLSGTSTFTVTATDANGVIGTRDYVIAIGQPADPRNIEVTGIVSMQSSIAHVIADSQILNVRQRQESLRDPDLHKVWGVWASCTGRSGDRNPDPLRGPAGFSNTGCSGGMDRHFGERFSLGGGIGYDRFNSRVGLNGSDVEGQVKTALGYGSFHPPSTSFFFNGVIGHQDISIQTSRFVPLPSVASVGYGIGIQPMSIAPMAGPAGANAAGTRNGRQTFSSWTAGYEFKHDAWKLTPFAKMDTARADLDAYDEDGAGMYDLHYGTQSISTRTSTFGFRVKYRKQVKWGILEPRARIELLRDFHNESESTIRYVDLPSGPMYRIQPRSDDRSRTILELGVVLKTKRRLVFNLEYRGMFGGLYDNDNSITLTFQNDR